MNNCNCPTIITWKCTVFPPGEGFIKGLNDSVTEDIKFRHQSECNYGKQTT